MWINQEGIFCLIIIVAIATGHILENPLNGRHLRVLPVEFPTAIRTVRNATGHIISATGPLPLMLEAMSLILNFSYHYVPGNRITTFDDTPQGRGSASYLLKDEADYLLSSIVALSYRYQMVDFPTSWYYAEFGTIVPYPSENVNLSASLRPLSYQVWIAILVSVGVLTLFLRIISTCYSSKMKRQNGRRLTSTNNWGRYYYFVMGNLVSQGVYWPWNKGLTLRVAAGAWCCACFFLVQIYCSTLISYLTSPNTKTIVDSFFDIPKTPGVTLTLDRGMGLDQILKTTNTTFANTVVRMLKDNPSLRCNVTTDCLQKVRSGTSVFSAGTITFGEIMAKDVQDTGTCHYTALKETFWNTGVFNAVAKKSPYTEYLSRAILRVREAGLGDHWGSWFIPSSDKCSIYNRDKRPQRLTLSHMSSAFVLLGVGCFISLVAFLAEHVRFFFNSK